jgi:predicted nucleic acid-binding Zn ribbon protein
VKKEKNITFCLICKKQTKYGGKTCSRECSNKLKKINNRENRTCVNCKKSFEAKKTVKKKLCSDECRKEWNSLPENKEKRIKKSHNAIKEKYDGKFFVQTDEFIEKLKKTKKEKYGDENYVNSEKSKSTKEKKIW